MMKMYELRKDNVAIDLNKVNIIIIKKEVSSVGQVRFNLYLYFSKDDYYNVAYNDINDATNEYNKILAMMKEN